MPAASVLIKPVSSACNLRCKYCFYHSISQNRSVSNYGVMNEDTLVNLVKNILEYADGHCTFAFQGGEPTLAGLDFFKRVVELQKEYNVKRVKVENTIQTNGTLIDEEWAEFLAQHDFLMGLSVDGPKDINDGARIDINEKSTFNRVMNTVRLFKKYNVQYNVLSVVTSYSTRHIRQLYSFYKKHGVKFLQFIPCMDEERGSGNFHSLTGEKYGYFLKILFDLWYEDFIKGEKIDIRYFSNLVQMAAGYRPEECGMNGTCQCYFVVEADGGVYPCDFYVKDEWRLGNINQDRFESMLDHPRAKSFVQSSTVIDEKCMQCRYYSLCRGGCRRWREDFVENKITLNKLCPAYEAFLEHASDRIFNLSRLFLR